MKVSACCVAAILFSTTSLQAASFTETKLTASDGAASDDFGYSVAISGSYALIGAYDDNDAGSNSGSAYLFDVATGTELRKFTASDAASGDTFGRSVAISGNYAIIGSSLDNNGNGADAGSAYVFDLTTGAELFKLTASDGAGADYFGHDVAIDGTTAIVGARGDNGGGSAYLFDVTTGSQLAKLTASDRSVGDNFGVSVGISGNRAIVGASLDNDNGGDSGSAYIFDTTTFAQVRKLTASDGAGADYFGHDVDIDGTKAIVGAYADNDDGGNSGSAYIFDVASGTEDFKLTAADAGAGDEFGRSVSISGNKAVVGAQLDNDDGANSGSAYLFNVSDGSQLQKFTASDAQTGDNYGWAVDNDDGNLVIGARDEDEKGSNAGAAYLELELAPIPPVPVPAGAWLLASGLGLMLLRRGRA